MAVSDILVIHFAFGSPFGVYQIARGGREGSAGSAVNVALHFVLWPIFALAFFRSWLVEYSVPEETFEGKVADIRSKLEELIFSANSPVSILGFREVFTRYIDLTSALNHKRTVNPLKDLLKVTGHTNIATATACMNRRNRQQMLFHQQQSRNEFIDLVLVSTYPQSRQSTIDLVMQLGHLLEDKKTVDEIAGRALA